MPEKFYGMFLQHKGFLKKFWKFECPCGKVVEFAINELPVENTSFPCDNPNHFVIGIGPSKKCSYLKENS